MTELMKETEPSSHGDLTRRSVVLFVLTLLIYMVLTLSVAFNLTYDERSVMLTIASWALFLAWVVSVHLSVLRYQTLISSIRSNESSSDHAFEYVKNVNDILKTCIREFPEVEALAVDKLSRSGYEDEMS